MIPNTAALPASGAGFYKKTVGHAVVKPDGKAGKKSGTGLEYMSVPGAGLIPVLVPEEWFLAIDFRTYLLKRLVRTVTLYQLRLSGSQFCSL